MTLFEKEEKIMKKVLLSLMAILLLVSGCSFLLPPKEPTESPKETSLPTESPTNTAELMPEPSETLAVEATEAIDTVKTEEPQIVEVEEGRHLEEIGKFSYEPIEGWSLQEFPGLNTKILVPGADLLQYGMSMVFIREAYTGTTEDYAELGMENAKKTLQNFQFGEPTRFETLSGLTVIKHKATYKASDMEFDSIFYSIGDEARPELAKLVVTFARFPGAPEEVVSLVENLIKSIRFED